MDLKRILPFLLIAVLLFACAFPAQSALAPAPQNAADGALVADSDVSRDDCTCICHLFYSVRDDLLQSIVSKTIDGKTLLRVLSYYVRLFTWRMLGIQQYCACEYRHY